MKVSVVITTYNRAGYVAEAIDSILRQTEQDFELIVVDDGSTDATEVALERFRGRIRYRRIEHAGAAAARNAGMELARGDYVCCLDSDDRCHPLRLAVQAAVLDAFPDVAWVASEISAFDDQGLWREFHLRDYHEPAYRRGGITYENLFGRSLPIADLGAIDGIDPAWRERRLYLGEIFDTYLKDLVIFAVSIMFRRRLLAETGPQNPRLEYFEEREFALRLCRGRRVAFVDLPLYQHRYHGGQMSTSRGSRAGWIQIRKQQDLLHVFRIHGIRDRRYYQSHRPALDRQFARLCRAVAVPLLGFECGTRHQRSQYPRRARVYLHSAARAGHPFRLLWICSWLPRALRRVLMKIESL